MNRESTALLIVDMMNDHVHSDGVSHRFGTGMPDADRLMIVRNNQRLLAAARSVGLPAIHIRNEYRWDVRLQGDDETVFFEHHDEPCAGAEGLA